MKKWTLIIGILIFLLIAAVLLGKYVKKNVGDMRPALLPPVQPQSNKTLGPLTGGQTDGLPLNVPSGLSLSIFANNIPGARDLIISPGGAVLVSETAAGNVVALPDANQDGQSDQIVTVLSGLKRPHGLAFSGNQLFVAEETGVVRYQWNEQSRKATKDKELFSLPVGGRHFTRSLAIDSAGKLYVSIGSSCDVCVEKQPWLAAVIVSDSDGHTPRLFATGLRNPVFLALQPQTGALWTTEMGRDFLGDDLPPDEINMLQEGKDYGWPICYGDNVHDTTFDKKQHLIDPCAKKEKSVYQIPAHSAPLGLTFIQSSQFPADWQEDLLVAYHGSWNRSVPIGYKIVRLKVRGNTITGSEDFLTGFLQGSQAVGRPVDMVFDQAGNLFVSDDKTGRVYLITRRGDS